MLVALAKAPGTTAIDDLSARMEIEPRRIEDEIEPLLLDRHLIQLRDRGRIATPLGRAVANEIPSDDPPAQPELEVH